MLEQDGKPVASNNPLFKRRPRNPVFAGGGIAGGGGGGGGSGGGGGGDGGGALPPGGGSNGGVNPDTNASLSPNTGSGNVTVDGRTGRIIASPGGTWANIRDGVGTSASVTVLTAGTNDISTGWTVMYRGILTFDTTTIPTTSTVVSAKLRIWPDSGQNGAAADSIVVCEVSPIANDNVQAADYGSFGTTKLSNEITIATIFSNPAFPYGYQDFVLNSIGLTFITRGGITRLGLRSLADLNNIEPAGEPGGAGNNFVTWKSADHVDAVPPLLEISYRT